MANDLFLAYLSSNGKIPLSSVKDKSNWLSEPPKDSDYVGILKSDIIQIDFDNKEDSEIALKIVEDKKLKCNVLKTSRGYHLYFKNNPDIVKSQSVGIFNAIGLECDVGLGSKDRVVPLRTTKTLEDGSEFTRNREWLLLHEDLDVIPTLSTTRPVAAFYSGQPRSQFSASLGIPICHSLS